MKISFSKENKDENIRQPKHLGPVEMGRIPEEKEYREGVSKIYIKLSTEMWATLEWNTTRMILQSA